MIFNTLLQRIHSILNAIVFTYKNSGENIINSSKNAFWEVEIKSSGNSSVVEESFCVELFISAKYQQRDYPSCISKQTSCPKNEVMLSVPVCCSAKVKGHHIPAFSCCPADRLLPRSSQEEVTCWCPLQLSYSGSSCSSLISILLASSADRNSIADTTSQA